MTSILSVVPENILDEIGKMQRYMAKLEKDYLLSWKPYTRRESSSAREN